MAFKRNSTPSDTEYARRVAIIGAPNSLKTTSLIKCPTCKTVAECEHAWPRPLTIISMPGEKGWNTIPPDVQGIQRVVWETDDVTKASPHAVVKDVESTTWSLLAEPGLKSFAVDGAHKLYSFYYKRRRLDIKDWVIIKDNQEANERQLDLTAYGNDQGGAYADFMLYLTKVLTSPVPYVVITLWEGSELDDPDNKMSRSTHIHADLPGKLAKRFAGEFGVTLYSEATKPDPQGRVKGWWQIRPEGKVWGVGVKVRPEVAVTLPSKMEQSFATLEKALRGEKT